ncbi:MAG: hypothetical protein ACI8WB_005232 [Phenylobacterium sp.]
MNFKHKLGNNKARHAVVLATLLTGLTAMVPMSSLAESQDSAEIANDIDFSIGGGYPYIGVVEVSVAADEGQRRFYANYKLGWDDGFSAGFEQAIDDGNHHAFGVMVGALGIKDSDEGCENDVHDDGIFCIFAELLDDRTTNGVGLSYSYNHRGLNNRGVRVRFELGYGKTSHRHRGEDSGRVDGGINVTYQF